MPDVREFRGEGYPLISVLILNYNGLKYVDQCLSSVFNTNYSRFEVIFIDNASTDGSVEHVIHRYGSDARLRIVRNPRNYGFAKGNNIGARYARGDYLVFLNVDTKVDPSWLKELVKAFELNPDLGAAQAKLLKMNNPQRLDTCGHMLTPYGFTYEVGLNDEANRYTKSFEILAGKGAALIVRHGVFEEVGGFDEDYFLLREETDLCWRIWLRGYRVVFIPDAVVYHAVGGTFKRSNIQSIYFFQRNMIITLIKNLEFKNVLKVLPIHVSLLLIDSLIADLKGKKASRLLTALRCFSYIINNFKRIWIKRRVVQSTRKMNDEELFKHVMIKVSIVEKLHERSLVRGFNRER